MNTVTTDPAGEAVPGFPHRLFGRRLACAALPLANALLLSPAWAEGSPPGQAFDPQTLHQRGIDPELAYLLLDRVRITNAFTSLHLDRQAILLAAFTLFALGTAIQAFRRNYSLIPCIGMLSCAYLMIEIPAKSWAVFFGWMALGLAVYFAYGRRNSRLGLGS